jgi:hypothetical protein
VRENGAHIRIDIDLPRLVRIKHARVEHAVELERHVVGRDGRLAGDLNGHLLEALDVGDAVEEGHEDGQAGLEDAVELAHALDDPRRLLRHEPDHRVGRQRRPLEVRRRHDAAAAAK